ncbi:hypothetical protein TCAL_02126 [Tigriopus californicus]|uniref:CBM21 domain-containing protein n=1 Tax=Tigriopus californicus TaxID=6832 RepID=A0A553N827_TIGCA|nr:uncharacterized protein LOC131885856 [Tigriopus californicus]XP_059090024.1 uncharacterized protein LOC131885856 [Tigriopus californicus]TRY61573.1 hypothetical protein TCAL_02126 [Tigriopus californicus]|eukprot:TCALIF_02126-PA protein Name:"Similar to Gbs-76A Glycogen-binding subunit 76A (Drosophila melanogaster)" AED:0.01 eAED:0.01 QI:113/1/1/1/1/1/2/686/1034
MFTPNLGPESSSQNRSTSNLTGGNARPKRLLPIIDPACNPVLGPIFVYQSVRDDPIASPSPLEPSSSHHLNCAPEPQESHCTSLYSVDTSDGEEEEEVEEDLSPLPSHGHSPIPSSRPSFYASSSTGTTSAASTATSATSATPTTSTSSASPSSPSNIIIVESPKRQFSFKSPVCGNVAHQQTRRTILQSRRVDLRATAKQGLKEDVSPQRAESQRPLKSSESGGSPSDFLNKCCLSSLVSSHFVALQYSCPVLNLCQSTAKMLSMSYKAQTDLFTRSLQSRLEYLGDPESERVSEPDESGFINWLELRPKKEVLKFIPAPGTTFPPNRFAQFDLFRAKFHSESDLSPKHMPSNAPAGKLPNTDCLHEEDHHLNTQKDEADESADSDLFFDFDIGSPEEDAVLPDSDDVRENMLLRNKACDLEATLQDEDDISSNESLSPRNNLRKANEAFGSASSGLCSDMETLQSGSYETRRFDDENDELNECKSIDPEDWPAHKLLHFDTSSFGSANSTPKAARSPMGDRSPSSGASLVEAENEATTKEDDHETMFQLETEEPDVARQTTEKELNQSEEDLENSAQNKGREGISKDANDEDDENVMKDFTIYNGEARHKVANSKLNALISLLEKDREYSRNSSRQSSVRSSKEGSPQKESSPPKSAMRKGFQSSLTPIAASPANFSYLSSKSNMASNASSSSEDIHSVPSFKASIARCESTPVLSGPDRAYMQSPKMPRKTSNADVTEEPATITKDTKVEGMELPERVRRATSLRSGKTPPGTPGRRKIVRFADVFGLDLADVKTFLDEIPKVPKSAYKDLKDVDLSDIESDTGSSDSSAMSLRKKKGFSNRSLPMLPNQELPSTSLVPMFSQPGGFANFFDLLNTKKVCLENAYMANKSAIQGTIRVQNLSFQKKVLLRYTTNEWVTSSDLEATYIDGSCDGFSDKFTFHLGTAAPLLVGQRIQFCLCYQTGAEEFWDNNVGKNYVFQCLGVAGSNNVKAPSSNAIPLSTPRHSAPHYGGSGGYSQSPSALSEDPWLRYL